MFRKAGEARKRTGILIFFLLLFILFSFYIDHPVHDAGKQKPLELDESRSRELEEDNRSQPNEALMSIEKNLMWKADPELDYEEIKFFHEFGFIGYNNAGMDMVLLDGKTGEVISGVDPEGGFRIPYLYIYSAKTKAFYYDEEYAFHRERTETVRKLSKDRIISVFLPANGSVEDFLDRVPEDFWSNSGFAIYFNGKFMTDFVFDEVIGGNQIAIVKQNQKYALAGSDGQLRTDFVFDEVSPVAARYIAVKSEGLWGFIDPFGKEVIPSVFDDAIVIDDDTAFIKVHGKYGILDVHETASQLSAAGQCR